ncbi:hypothetical protein CBL_07363 [Carabus blaptoides fortunei]
MGRVNICVRVSLNAGPPPRAQHTIIGDPWTTHNDKSCSWPTYPYHTYTHRYMPPYSSDCIEFLLQGAVKKAVLLNGEEWLISANIAEDTCFVVVWNIGKHLEHRILSRAVLRAAITFHYVT